MANGEKLMCCRQLELGDSFWGSIFLLLSDSYRNGFPEKYQFQLIPSKKKNRYSKGQSKGFVTDSSPFFTVGLSLH